MGSFKVGGKTYHSMKAYRERNTPTPTTSVMPTTTTTIRRDPPDRGRVAPEPKLIEKRPTTTTTSQKVQKAKTVYEELRKVKPRADTRKKRLERIMKDPG